MSATTDYTERRTSAARDDLERPGRHFDEAKAGFRSSEFYVMAVFVAAVLLTTYLDADSLNREDGWRFAAFAVVAYIVSRGLAKLGVRQPANNDR
jgi:hypothetical protein